MRTDLGAQAGAGRSAARMPVIAFAQLSDVHVVDAQSPLRLEFTDRLDDPSPLPPTLFSSAYRAHEMLSGHIADAMVRQINGIGTGPVTGTPLALAIQTGDNSDNSQFNEVRWNIGILNGGQVRIDSGSLLKYEGVADDNSAYYDPGYWHPHGTPAGKVDDVYRKRYGFPVVPGLLDAARRPFDGRGPEHAVVLRLRQPRRPGAGQLPAEPPAQPGLHRCAEAELAARGPLPRRAAQQPASGDLAWASSARWR